MGYLSTQVSRYEGKDMYKISHRNRKTYALSAKSEEREESVTG